MSSRREFAGRIAAGGMGALAALGLPRPRPAVAAPAPADDWTSVRDFGARGDGETDDTAAIQAAFDARSAGVIYFPAGGYVLTRTVRVRRPVAIVGDAPRGTYLRPRMRDGSPALEIGHPGYRERLRGMWIANLTVRGAGDGAGRAGGIRLHAVYDSLVQNVRIETLGWGLDANRAIAVRFEKLVVTGMRAGDGAPGEGVYLYGQSNACVFDNLRATDNDGAALRYGYGQNLTLVGPVIETTRSPAIVIGRQRDGTYIKCRGVTILNPYFERNRPYDMVFLRGTPPVVIGGYWGPLDREYVAPFEYHMPVTAVGCDFPPSPGGAVRVERDRASMLFMGCTFGGEVATFGRASHRRTASLRVLDAEGDRTIGGASDG